MAYSSEQWERTKAYFESGQYSLSDISSKTGIDKSQISRKSKTQQWVSGRNADYIESKVVLATKKATENTTTLQTLDDIADEKIRHKKLIYGNAELLASQIPKMLEACILKEENKETGEIVETLVMSSKQLKEMAEANDQLAVTLKVADRHAKSGDVNVSATAGAVANNNIRTLKDFYEE